MKNFLGRALDRFVNPFARRIAQFQVDPATSPLGLARKLDRNAHLLAASLIAVNRGRPDATLRDWEFSVFSQFGEDGIIQYLLDRVPIIQETFVEFGVENFLEANTRFLLTHNRWSGLVIDGSQGNVDRIRNDEIFFRHEIAALCSFITRENINELIARKFRGDLGLLSVDIDGNDYWVWEAVDVVSPRIVVCEYNSLFGAERAVTVPYNPNFVRSEAHYSFLYFGASLRALCDLAERKGYVFVGCNADGNNAFFVRKDVAGRVTPQSVEQGFVRSKFRESRNRQGQMDYVSGADRLPLIAELPLFDLGLNRLVTVGEACGGGFKPC